MLPPLDEGWGALAWLLALGGADPLGCAVVADGALFGGGADGDGADVWPNAGAPASNATRAVAASIDVLVMRFPSRFIVELCCTPVQRARAQT